MVGNKPQVVLQFRRDPDLRQGLDAGQDVHTDSRLDVSDRLQLFLLHTAWEQTHFNLKTDKQLNEHSIQ